MEDRIKRIKRLKVIIMTMALVVFMIPLVLSAALFVKVEQLKQQLIYLEEAVLLHRNTVVETGMDKAYSKEAETISGVKDIPQTEAMTDSKLRRVYLTFDDGPGPYTEEILDILDEYDVKATFFVTAMHAPDYEAVYARIVEDGHSLGIHTYSHVYDEVYASPSSFQQDFMKMQDYLYEITGERVKIYRFPGGSSNSVSDTPIIELIAWLEQENIEYYDWNVSGKDSGSTYIAPEEIAANCINGVKDCNTAIVLLHDSAGKRSTIEALPLIIEGIEQLEDTILLPIDEETVPIQHISITKE